MLLKIWWIFPTFQAKWRKESTKIWLTVFWSITQLLVVNLCIWWEKKCKQNLRKKRKQNWSKKRKQNRKNSTKTTKIFDPTGTSDVNRAIFGKVFLTSILEISPDVLDQKERFSFWCRNFWVRVRISEYFVHFDLDPNYSQNRRQKKILEKKPDLHHWLVQSNCVSFKSNYRTNAFVRVLLLEQKRYCLAVRSF